MAPQGPLSRDAEAFLVWMTVERGRSANTISSYRRDLRKYEDFLAKRKSNAVEAQEDDVLDKFTEFGGE